MSQESVSSDEAALAVQAGQNLSRKKKVRGGYRSHVTKLTNEAKTEIDSEEASSIKIDQISVALKEKLKLLTAIDQEIFLLVKDDEVEAEVLECEELKSRIYGTIVELESKKVLISGNNSNENVAASSSAATTVIYKSPDSTTPKIPKLNLPKYSGDPKKFHEWWDQYEVIYNNSTISPVNKFRHLKTLLEGQALTVIAGIQMTGANYENVIEILRDRFAQRNIIVNSHMEALLNLQKVFWKRM